jgi:ADP-ribose pyrophosphatase YjhB (NUDIX family)
MSKLIKNLLNEALTGRKRHVGVLIKALDTNRFLLLKRAGDPHKGTFSLLSGGLNPDENPLEGLSREVGEEIKFDANKMNLKYITKEVSDKAEFYYYIGTVKNEFLPTLDFENTAFQWVDKDNLPTPLYPNLDKKIAQA